MGSTENFELSVVDKKFLVELVKSTIAVELNLIYPEPERMVSGRLQAPMGAFVTLRQKGELRGCIGNIISDQPLEETIKRMAIESAFYDPRFEPLSADEFNQTDVEISILSPIDKVNDIQEIEVGLHGIIIKQGRSQGLLLPQVAVEYQWNRTEFLEHTCQKAGLPRNAWKNPRTEIFYFSALVFSEEEVLEKKYKSYFTHINK
jgi:AmmeMemoRadiSam system protein A